MDEDTQKEIYQSFIKPYLTEISRTSTGRFPDRTILDAAKVILEVSSDQNLLASSSLPNVIEIMLP